MRRTLSLLLAASLLAPSIAEAQTVIMRRPIDQTPGGSGSPNPMPAPTPTPTPVLQSSWVVGGWSDEMACSSSSTGTRSVDCVREDGVKVADGSCTGTRPEATRTGQRYAGCTTGWSTSDWGPYDSTCSSATHRERSVECRLIVPGESGFVVDDARCSDAKPMTREGPVVNVSGCSYAWQTTAWSGWSSTCSDSASRSRTVTCGRSDGGTADEAMCPPVRPTSSETSAIHSGCVYDPYAEFKDPKNFVFTSTAGTMTLTSGNRWQPGPYMYAGAYDVGTHVMFHPEDGGVDVGVDFVAPRSGTFRFQGRYFAGNACGDGVIATYGSRTAVVFRNEVPFDYERTMSAGQRERFGVNANGDQGCDSTGLVLSITQP